MSSPVLPNLKPDPIVFPIVVSGPSGVGKTVLVKALLARDPGLINSVSTTSRPPRVGEQDGVHYRFCEAAEFEAGIRAGGFLEWARVHDHYYGTPRAPLEANLAAGRGVVLNIDVQGARQVKAARPDTLLIFVYPPSLEVLEQRLRHRGTDSEEEIRLRLKNARGEMEEAPHYDYLVENDEVSLAVDRIAGIVAAERHRVARRLGARP